MGEATTSVGSRLSLTSSRKGVQINPQQIARVTGVLFIITIVASIPAAFVLYAPVLDDPNYIVGAGADPGVSLGALLEFIVVIANIGTAVVLFQRTFYAVFWPWFGSVGFVFDLPTSQRATFSTSCLLLRTRVNKDEKRSRSTNADLGLHNFNGLPRPIIIVTPRPAGLRSRAYYSLPKARGLHYRSRRAARWKLMIWRLMIATVPEEPLAVVRYPPHLLLFVDVL